jgi:hypothetical protein
MPAREGNVQMNLAEADYKDTEWIRVARDRFHCWVHVNTNETLGTTEAANFKTTRI